jgi:hypothetical protein
LHLSEGDNASTSSISARVKARICVSSADITSSALLDSGAEQHSYIGEAFFLQHLAGVHTTAVTRSVRLGGSQEIVTITRSVQLPVELTSPTGRRTTALVDMDILPTAITIIIGWPHIVKHFSALAIDLIQAAQTVNAKQDANRHLAMRNLAFIRDSSPATPEALRTDLPTGATNPLWITPYAKPPEEDIVDDMPIFPEYGAYEERNAEFLKLLPDRIMTKDSALHAQALALLLREEYREVFVWRRWKFVDAPPVRLNWKAEIPDHWHAAPRPCARPKQEQAEIAINRFVEQGYWEPTTLTPRYATPVVYVWKPDGSIRVCADYPHHVNRYLAPFETAYPDIHLEVEKMAQYASFINVDLKDGYYGLGLHPTDCEKLTVTTHMGNFIPKAVPMGITVGGAILQNIAYQVFAPLAHRAIIMQDNLILGIREAEDPIPILRQLLDICSAKRVTLAIRKCEFMTTSAMFWGYVLTPGKYAIDPIRKQGLAQITCPDSLKSAQRFLGLANFFSGFIPQYRDKVDPLLAMLRKEFDFKHVPQEIHTAFTALKSAMATSTELFLPRRDCGPWILRADASNVGVAAVLLQRCPIDSTHAQGTAMQEEQGYQLQPLALVSFPLSEPARRNWPTHTGELYGLVMACKKLRTLIDSHPIVLESDHRNLLYTQEHHSPLTRRWMAYLQANFNLAAFLHRPGVLNELADMLSRLYTIQPIDAVSAIQQHHSVETAVSRIIEYAPQRQDVTDEHLKHIAVLIEAVETARTGFWPTLDTPHQHPVPGGEAATLHALTPAEAFEAVHNSRLGHSGWRRTLSRLRQLQPGTQISQRQVRTLVENCATCQKYRDNIKETSTEIIHNLPAPALYGLVTADTFKLPKDSAGNTHVLLIVHHATKMVDLIPMQSKTGEDVAKALFAYSCNEGIPAMFLTDPGSELSNEHVDSLMGWLGVTHALSMAKRPQGHGTERSIGRAKQNLAILVGADNAIAHWSDRSVLPCIKLMMNRDVNDEVGASPLNLRYGTIAMARFARLANTDELPHPEDAPQLIADLDANLRSLQAKADAIHELRRARRRAQGSEQQHTFATGDYILWRSPAILRPEGPLTAQLLGPYEIINQVGNKITAKHMSTGKEATLHHDRCIYVTVEKELAQELARQDYPAHHSITSITQHKGDLSARNSLEFLTRFADDDILWLPYTEVADTTALHTYVLSRQCTRFYLLPSTEELATLRADARSYQLPQIVGRHHKWNDWTIPALGELLYVSAYAFNYSLIDADLPGSDDTEYVLEAHLIQATAKRLDIKFCALPLTVSWPLDRCAAYVARSKEHYQIALDRELLSSHPALARKLLGTTSTTDPGPLNQLPGSNKRQALAPGQAPAQEPQSMQGKLRDNQWVDIIIQNDHGQYLDAFVPSRQIDVRIARSRTRPTEPRL